MWWDLDAEIDPSSVPKRILRLRAVGHRNYASLLLECCVACCTLVADTLRCLPNLRAEEIMSIVVVQRDLGRDRPKSSAYSSLAAPRFFRLLSSPLAWPCLVCHGYCVIEAKPGLHGVNSVLHPLFALLAALPIASPISPSDRFPRRRTDRSPTCYNYSASSLISNAPAHWLHRTRIMVFLAVRNARTRSNSVGAAVRRTRPRDFG
ncbi:hypothetical protein HDV57DRAFT_490194 [Trichoderma longibrachiatum]